MWHTSKRQIIAIGKVHIAARRQLLHHKPLPENCYKVSVDKALVDAACIPDIANNSFKTVKDVVGCFVAWPKDRVILIDEEKVYTYQRYFNILTLMIDEMFDACGTFVSTR